MKVLIIEDNKDLSDSIKSYLSMEEYVCEQALTESVALEKISLYEYDCILLDISLPDGNGFTILEELNRLNKEEGVIIISAKDSVDDRIRGLGYGADDYLTKPFHLAELAMRILALIRRRKFHRNNRMAYGDLCVNLREKKAYYGTNEIKQLSGREFELLLFFMSSPNRVLTKGVIAEHLMGDNADLYNNHDVIYAHVKNLRRKLESVNCPNYIKTVYGMGYKFENIIS